MICVSIAKNGALSQDTVNVPPNCVYELLTPTEINNLSASASTISAADFAALYQQYFGFDPVLFTFVLISCLTAYAMGHTLGAVWKAWSQAF